MNKTTKRIEPTVERICIICQKPMQVKVKDIKAAWGKSDWKHRACYLSNRKYFKQELV